MRRTSIAKGLSAMAISVIAVYESLNIVSISSAYIDAGREAHSL